MIYSGNIETYGVFAMKKRFLILILLLIFCTGCSRQAEADVVASTLPVYEFTSILCEDTGVTVSRLVTEAVSCLHDYTLQVSQMRAVESAELVIINGVGLEEFLGDILVNANQVADASEGLELACGEHHDHEGGHHHEFDPHIWLSPENAKQMCRNICKELSVLYPNHKAQFETNLSSLLESLDALQAYGQAELKDLKTREIITFHDGFGYFAGSFNLHILKAVEEESGSEASAKELIEIIDLVQTKQLPAIFTEQNGSTSAAQIIAAEAGVKVFALDMAMAGDSYFEAMYHNIRTIKEALA